MRRLRSRRGLTFVEVLVAASILGATVILAGAIFPFSHLLQDRSSGYSRASSVLQVKLEQIRMLESQQLTYAGLRAAGLIDEYNGNGTYTFNTTDSIPTRFIEGTSVLRVTGAGGELSRVDLTLTWQTSRGRQHQVTAMTYMANRLPWREP